MNLKFIYLLLGLSLIFTSCEPEPVEDDEIISGACNLESGIVPPIGYKYVLLAENLLSHTNVDIQYWDSEIGFILEKQLPFRLLRTDDGGLSWTELRRFEGASGFKFRTGEEGNVFVNLLNENSTSAQDVYRNIIYRTLDGGLTWESNEFLAAGKYLHPTYTFFGNTLLLWKEYQPNKQLLLVENYSIFDEPISFDTLINMGAVFNGAFQAEEDARIYPGIGELIITNPGSNSKFYRYDDDDGSQISTPIDFGQKIEEVYHYGSSIYAVKGIDGNFYLLSDDDDVEHLNLNFGEEAILMGYTGTNFFYMEKATDCGVDDAFRTSNYNITWRIKDPGNFISQDMVNIYNKSFVDQYSSNIIIVGQRSLHKLELE